MVVAALIDSLSKVGAITGIVSFVGVGLLILLVASQSRQIRAMREWIDDEPERQAETAQRVIAEVQRRIAAARERRAAAASGQPMPPAPPVPARPPAPGTLGATPEARALAAAKGTDSTSAPADPAGSVPPPSADGEAPVFAPLTPAADADADAATDVAAPAEDLLSDPVPGEPGQETQAADALPPEYDPLAAATPAAQASDPRFAADHFALDDDFHDDEQPRGNRMLFGVGAAALIAGIVLAGVLLFNGDDSTPTTAGSGSSSGQTKSDDTGGTSGTDDAAPSTPDAVDPATVRVVVLNGTTVNGLAQSVTDQLTGKGYSVSQPNTLSSNQTLSTSMVEYRQGKSAEARQVAKDLGIASGNVQPIDADVSAAAPETAQVVVVTGQDLASSATSGTSG